jgi:hypothetical protein
MEKVDTLSSYYLSNRTLLTSYKLNREERCLITKNIRMKKFLIATGIATVAFASVAAAQTYTFSANLMVGSTGADVVALQTALINAGHSIPAIAAGGAKGYFGSQTKAAVMAYQATHISATPTGFVGPLTRAALNGGAMATVPTTPATGCPAGYVCTPTVGTTPTTPTTSTNITTIGAEGLITTKLASTPIADANIRDYAGVPVYGIEVKAQGSDMIVDRVLLQIGVTVSGSASNPVTFVRKLYAYDGATLLKSWDLMPTDFNKDSSDRYYIVASGIRFVVPRDTTKNLTFKIDTVGVSSDQAARVVTIQGYAGNTQNVRAVDGAGLSSYTDMSGSSNSRQQTFNASGTSSLTVTLNSGLTPKATNNKVSTTDGVRGLTMEVIDIKSQTGTSVVRKIYTAVNATSTAGLPSTLYLYDGSTLISSVSAPSTNGAQVAFTDLRISIPKDTTKQLTIKADFASTVSGQAASTSIPVSGIQFEDPSGTLASSSIPSSALSSNSQYLYNAAPRWVLVSTPTSVASAGVLSVSSSSVSGTIKLMATAVGGAMTKPVAGDFTTVFASSTQTTYTTANSVTGGNKSITVEPSDATVGEGGTYTVTITDTVYSNDSEIASSQPLFMAISEIDSVTGNVTITNQTWGLTDFYTPVAQLTRAL